MTQIFAIKITYSYKSLDKITNILNPGSGMISNRFFIKYKYVLTISLLYLLNVSSSSGCYLSNKNISPLTLPMRRFINKYK